mmetsp:Transcript_73887/g.203914  ORF Transcript_73887/g.203914 Transcript_73887/m.203914 type:complete len:351 (-) Transcript_73887:222-1274(-)
MSRVKCFHSMHLSSSRAISNKRSHGMLGFAIGNVRMTPSASTATVSSWMSTMTPCCQWCRQSVGGKRASFSNSVRWTHHDPPFATEESSIAARKAPSRAFPHWSRLSQRAVKPDMFSWPMVQAMVTGKNRAKPAPELARPQARSTGAAAKCTQSAPLHAKSRPRILPNLQRTQRNSYAAATSLLPTRPRKRERSHTQAARQHCTARVSLIAKAAQWIRGTPPCSRRPQMANCRLLPSKRAAMKSTRQVVACTLQAPLRGAHNNTMHKTSPAICACGACMARTTDITDITVPNPWREDLCDSSCSPTPASSRVPIAPTIPKEIRKVPTRKAMADATVPKSFSQYAAATLPA